MLWVSEVALCDELEDCCMEVAVSDLKKRRATEGTDCILHQSIRTQGYHSDPQVACNSPKGSETPHKWQ